MAERRIFSRAIVRSDAFAKLSATAQLLYYHAAMDADDDGVVGSMRVAMMDARATPEDLAALEAAKFLLPIGKVWAVKHWWCMQTFRKDRYRPSTYQDELGLLEKKPDGSYTYKAGEKMGKTPATTVATNVATRWVP